MATSSPSKVSSAEAGRRVAISEITGWPVTVLGRGQRIVDGGRLMARPGDGQFVARERADLTGLAGTRLTETDTATNFGAEIVP